jgi:hypothetical protein
MSVIGVSNQNPSPYVGNAGSAGSAGVQAPKGQEIKEISPFSVSADYSFEEQAVFDEFSSGMPPPGWPPAHSSPQAKAMMDELAAMIEAAGSSDPLSSEGDVTMAQAMRMLKEIMLKNRASELELRDQQILQVYDLKLQAIEKDKEAAQAAFVASIIKGAADVASGAINVTGGVQQMGSIKNGASAEATQAIGLKAQGMAAGASGVGTMSAAFFEKQASDARAEADTLRAKADKIGQQLSQTGERYALAREVFLDTQQTEKSILDSAYQAINKRLSV